MQNPLAKICFYLDDKNDQKGREIKQMQSNSGNFLFKWIGPVISQKEGEALFSWVNSHLARVSAPILLSNSAVTYLPRFEPKESLQIWFPLNFNDAEQAETFRQSVWQEHLSEETLRPFAMSFVSEAVSKAAKKLCVFDMDSTLIDQEVIDELARVKGVYEEISMITEAAMRGELDFKQSLHARVSYLRGMAFQEARGIISHLTVSPGGEALLQSLHSQNMISAIVSGGFDFVLQHFQKHLSINHVHAHHLMKDDEDLFTGEIEAPIIDAAYKQKLVQNIKNHYHLSLDQCVVVGDGANDLMMMQEAGISVSFCGKPKLAASVNTLIFDRNLFWIKHLI